MKQLIELVVLMLVSASTLGASLFLDGAPAAYVDNVARTMAQAATDQAAAASVAASNAAVAAAGSVQRGDSYTNLLGLSSREYLSTASLVVDARLQSEVICYITNDVVVAAPLYPSDGRAVKWRFTATNGTFNVGWPTNLFCIPSSSSMVYTNAVTNQTTSIFVTEYLTISNKWMIQTYIWGY